MRARAHARLALAAALPVGCAIRSSEEVRVGGGVMGQYMSWGALAGAQLELNLTLRNQAPDPATRPNDVYAWVLLSDDSQFAAVLAVPGPASELCKSNFSRVSFAWAAARMGWPGTGTGADAASAEAGADAPLTPPVVTWWATVDAPATSTYHFLFLSCTEIELDFDTSLHFVNPGGEELSSGEIAYKPLSVSFAWVWAALGSTLLLAMAWAQVTWACQRRQRRVQLGQSPGAAADASSPLSLSLSSVRQGGVGSVGAAARGSRPPVRWLHLALLCVPVLAIINSLVTHAYYVDASASGVFSSVTGYAAALAGDAEAAALLAIILLLARGWQVTRDGLDAHEARYVAFVIAGFFTIFVSFQVVGGLFFLFVLILFYVLMLRYVFASVSWKLRLLAAFRAYSRTWLGGGAAAASGADVERDALAAGRGGLFAVDADAFFGDVAANDQYQVDMPPAPLSNTVYVAEAPSRGGGGIAAASAPPRDARHTIAVRELPAPLPPPPQPPTAAAPPPPLFAAASAAPRADDEEAAGRHFLAAGAEAPVAAAAAAAPTEGTGPPPPTPQRRSWLGALSRGLALFGDPTQVRDGTLTTRQMAALSYFRLAIVFFLFASALQKLWAVLAATTTPWVSFLLAELLNAAMLLYLVALFRPSADPRSSVLFDSAAYLDSQLESLLASQAQSAATAVSPHARGAAAAAAAAPPAPAPPPLLVIHNGSGTVHVAELLTGERA